MGNNGLPHTQDSELALTAELEECRASYRDLNDQHTKLDASLPYWPECTGIIFEMARLEEAMEGLRKKIANLTLTQAKKAHEQA